MAPEGTEGAPLPGILVRSVGKGRVVYFAAGVDAALWSYSYPYQRRVMARAIEHAAGGPYPIRVQAPMSVQTTFFEQSLPQGRRLVLHVFNGTVTSAHHGLPAAEVPLREESLPVHGITVRFREKPPKRFRVEPGALAVRVRKEGAETVVELPPLDLHAMLVGEY
jgi:hypothetical protein